MRLELELAFFLRESGASALAMIHMDSYANANSERKKIWKMRFPFPAKNNYLGVHSRGLHSANEQSTIACLAILGRKNGQNKAM